MVESWENYSVTLWLNLCFLIGCMPGLGALLWFVASCLPAQVKQKSLWWLGSERRSSPRGCKTLVIVPSPTLQESTDFVREDTSNISQWLHFLALTNLVTYFFKLLYVTILWWFPEANPIKRSGLPKVARPQRLLTLSSVCSLGSLKQFISMMSYFLCQQQLLLQQDFDCDSWFLQCSGYLLLEKYLLQWVSEIVIFSL